MMVDALPILLLSSVSKEVRRRLWILGRQDHGPLQVDDWRLLSQVGQGLLGPSLETS